MGGVGDGDEATRMATMKEGGLALGGDRRTDVILLTPERGRLMKSSEVRKDTLLTEVTNFTCLVGTL